jgi:hypothetical protein
VDSISMVLVTLREALSLDHHFAQAGFVLLA